LDIHFYCPKAPFWNGSSTGWMVSLICATRYDREGAHDDQPRPGEVMSNDADMEKLAARLLRRNLIARFKDDIVKQAFERAGGRCECRREVCKHADRCEATFKWDERGTAEDDGAWQANHRQSQASGGSDGAANCEILCVPCHKRTESFGASP
jgi:hypothetical protein